MLVKNRSDVLWLKTNFLPEEIKTKAIKIKKKAGLWEEKNAKAQEKIARGR